MTAPPRPASSLAAVTDLLDLQPAPASGDDPVGRTRLGVVSGRFLVPLGFPEATAQACLAYLGLRDTKTRVTRGGSLGFFLRQVVSGDEPLLDPDPNLAAIGIAG